MEAFRNPKLAEEFTSTKLLLSFSSDNEAIFIMGYTQELFQCRQKMQGTPELPPFSNPKQPHQDIVAPRLGV